MSKKKPAKKTAKKNTKKNIKPDISAKTTPAKTSPPFFLEAMKRTGYLDDVNETREKHKMPKLGETTLPINLVAPDNYKEHTDEEHVTDKLPPQKSINYEKIDLTLKNIINDLNEFCKSKKSDHEILAKRIELLGKNSVITDLLKQLINLSAEERTKSGESINSVVRLIGIKLGSKLIESDGMANESSHKFIDSNPPSLPIFKNSNYKDKTEFLDNAQKRSQKIKETLNTAATKYVDDTKDLARDFGNDILKRELTIQNLIRFVTPKRGRLIPAAATRFPTETELMLNNTVDWEKTKFAKPQDKLPPDKTPPETYSPEWLNSNRNLPRIKTPAYSHLLKNFMWQKVFKLGSWLVNLSATRPL